MTNQQLQTVLDALEDAGDYIESDKHEALRQEAIAIIKHMMQAEPGEPGNECPMCNHHQSSISYDCNNCGRKAQLAKPLTDNQIEKIRTEIFSTNNPYCPVDRKPMLKVARAIESAHGIKKQS